MFFSIKQYLKYYFNSKFKGILNNEFIQKFKLEVLDKKIPSETLDKINDYRNFHIENNKKIQQEDYGAGSKTINQNKHINTTDLAKNVSVTKKYGKVLHNLAIFLDSKHILELGTSLGISTIYFDKTKVTSIEGNSDLAAYTSKKLKDYNFNNIEVIQAQFDEVFEEILKKNTFDLIFVDGNHSKDATLRYFEIILKYKTNKTVVIFDDINWSFGMNNAWLIIKANKEVKLSIDLFTFGIVFFGENFKEKENVILWH